MSKREVYLVQLADGNIIADFGALNLYETAFSRFVRKVGARDIPLVVCAPDAIGRAVRETTQSVNLGVTRSGNIQFLQDWAVTNLHDVLEGDDVELKSIRAVSVIPDYLRSLFFRDLLRPLSV